MRLTAKPQYLLLIHRGKKKSHTVTALLFTFILQTSFFCVRCSSQHQQKKQQKMREMFKDNKDAFFL